MVALISIIVLNILLIKCYRQFITKKMKISSSNQISRLSKHQRTITRIIVASNTIYTIIRIIHLTSFAIFRVNIINGDYYLPSTNILRGIAYWLLASSSIFNLPIYLLFDKNLQNQFNRKIYKISGFLCER